MGTKRQPVRTANMLHSEIYAHGQKAKQQGRPIWVNPFVGEEAEHWRRGYEAGPDSSDPIDLPDLVRPTKLGQGLRRKVALETWGLS
jgi:hypothetical protein